MHDIHYDPDTHVYTVGGRVIPSVTEILKAEGCIDTRFPAFEL